MAEEPAGTSHVWHRAAAASPHRASCLHTDMHTRHDFTRNTCTFSQKVKKRAGYRQAQSAQPLSLGAEFRKEALLLTKGPHLWLTQVSSSQVIPRWLPPSATPLPSTHGFASWVVSPSSNTWACWGCTGERSFGEGWGLSAPLGQ